MTEPRPCPFCGSTRLSEPYLSSGVGLFVACNDCHSEGPKVQIAIRGRPGVTLDTRRGVELAIEKWNSRHVPPRCDMHEMHHGYRCDLAADHEGDCIFEGHDG